MLVKKTNKSEQLIFLGPNGFKLQEGKIAMKKSLPIISPKASTKISSIKNIHKPTKKENKVIPSGLASVSSIPSINSYAKLDIGTRRSKSKLLISHLSCQRLKDKDIQKLKYKEKDEYKQKQRDKLKNGLKDKWRNELTQDKTSCHQAISTARVMAHTETNEVSSELQQEQIPEEQKYKIILIRCKKILKTYSNQLKSAKKQIQSLKQQNNRLRKKNQKYQKQPSY